LLLFEIVNAFTAPQRSDGDVGARLEFSKTEQSTMVIEVLAIYKAKQLVKDKIRRRGEKVSEYTAADI
jgi:hypothetical protein